MKKVLILFQAMLISFVANCQKIYFSDTTNFWQAQHVYVHAGISDYSYIAYLYTGNVVVGGQLYNTFSNGYIREDTIAKKVFIRDCRLVSGLPPCIMDTTELLLYDYNLGIGDTLKTLIPSWVTDLSSTIINGISYKVWHFATNNADFHYTVIEGIGCTNGYDYPVNNAYPNMDLSLPTNQIICFTNKGAKYALSNPVWIPGMKDSVFFDNATSCSLAGIAQVNFGNKTVVLYPNPINEESKIIFPNTIKSGNLLVCNEMGQTIFSWVVANKAEILIGDKISTPGVYYYKITDYQSGKAYTGKIIKTL